MHGPLFSIQAHVSGCTYLPTYCDGICQSFDGAQRGDSLVCGSRNPGSGRVVLRRSFCMQFGEITGGWIDGIYFVLTTADDRQTAWVCMFSACKCRFEFTRPPSEIYLSIFHLFFPH